MHDRHVAVLGCGVIGLTTAITILEACKDKTTKCRVTIVAKDYPRAPSDATAVPSTYRASADFASAWAGGHHVSDAKNELELHHDKVTFDRMAKLSRERPWAKSYPSATQDPLLPALTVSQERSLPVSEPLVWVHQKEFFESTSNAKGQPPYTGILDWYPDFKPIPTVMLPAGIGAGCTFSTLDINVPVYHHWLLQRFLELGGRLLVQEVSSLTEAIKIATSANLPAQVGGNAKTQRVDALIVSPGLGARTLTDVRDSGVHPQRGQVVVVHAPWFSNSHTIGQVTSSRHSLQGLSVVSAQGGRGTYIIPRGDGTVICGGTRLVDDWNTKPRIETTKEILARCLRLAPSLVNPQKRTLVTETRVEDLEVLCVNVGLRPSRTGGVRLEQGQDIDNVKVIYSYGFGGWGYQASWGAAAQANKLLEEALAVQSVSHSRL